MEGDGEAISRFASRSPEDTQAVGAALARAWQDERDDARRRGERQPALVVALGGSLGAGKTVLVKGLAAGLGVDPAAITSPTFVIAGELEGRGGVRLLHADVYRVEDADALEAAGLRDWLLSDVVVVEWADRFPEAWPEDRLEITIEPGEGPSGRRIRAEALGARARRVASRWRVMVADEEKGSMALIVQKFGGTSVANVERIQNVARRVLATQRAGHQVAVVVSAMAGETDALVKLAHEAAGADPDPREYDALVSTGEQKTIALLAMAIHRLGGKARSFTGAQMGMRTDAAHTRARIQSIDTQRLREVLDGGAVAVIAGFQGIDEEGNVTTLGRGGSDTSAVAVAAALQPAVCEIYTDVDGVYTTDPNLVPEARKLARLSFDEMLEMASLGAKVLQIRSVKFAKQYGVPIHVRSSFSEVEGTWVTREEDVMERLVVSGVTYNKNEAKIRIRGVKDQPGIAARVFSPLGDAGIVVDMIIQNFGSDGSTDITFTVPKSDYRRALQIAEAASREIGASAVEGDENIAKVSIVGLGMKDHAGVASRMFRVLADEGINIQMISTSEIKISVVLDAKYMELALRALHAAFVEAGAADPAPED
jgi:aspartate kinase